MSASSLIDLSVLADAGYERYDRTTVTGSMTVTDVESDLAALARACDDLPRDPYFSGTNRFRRYARATVIPWSRSLIWLPPTRDPDLGEVAEYYQGEHNPEYPGARRQFETLDAEMRANKLLNQLILFDAEQGSWADGFSTGPLHVGVHLIKLAVRADEYAVSSPNMLHQDGEPFTFAHLISRNNVRGGVNAIARPGCAGRRPDQVSHAELFEQFTLAKPLDSYAVFDPKVSHYVSPVTRGDDDGVGHRSVLLIDFTPYVPRI